jgi:hypothetical protein
MSNPVERHQVTVEQNGRTFELTAEIRKMEKRHEPAPALLGGDRVGIEVEFAVTMPGDEKPTVFFLSRLVNEEDWIMDAKFGPNGFPHFSHGFGSRVTIPKGILDELADLLDHQAQELGLAAEIGRGVPLVLSAS